MAHAVRVMSRDEFPGFRSVVQIRLAALVLVSLLMLVPFVSAAAYGPASFADGGIQVDVRILASTPWQSPFTEPVNVSLGIIPQTDGVSEVNVSQVIISVHRVESDSTFTLVAADATDFENASFTGAFANITVDTSLSGSLSGVECYFAVYVSGTFWNGTDVVNYEAASEEDFIGPFSITPSTQSAQFLVGIALMGLSALIMTAGIWGVKKSRSERRRHRPLLEE